MLRSKLGESRLGLTETGNLAPHQSRGWGGELEEAVSYSMQPIPSAGLTPSRRGLTWDRVVQGAVLINFDDNQKAAAQDGYIQPPVITARPLSSPNPHNLLPSSLDSTEPGRFQCSPIKWAPKDKNSVLFQKAFFPLTPTVSLVMKARQGHSPSSF